MDTYPYPRLSNSPHLGPFEDWLILLLVDVATDALDLIARMELQSMVGAPLSIDELTAKKLSLLGVMALVATHRWRTERAALLAQLTSMGFPESPAQAALERAAWDVEAALALLLG